ncbi:hypothetical protein Drorol1_Dr00018129 [Drosera rotundifolia]
MSNNVSSNSGVMSSSWDVTNPSSSLWTMWMGVWDCSYIPEAVKSSCGKAGFRGGLVQFLKLERGDFHFGAAELDCEFARCEGHDLVCYDLELDWVRRLELLAESAVAQGSSACGSSARGKSFGGADCGQRQPVRVNPVSETMMMVADLVVAGGCGPEMEG